MKRFSNEDGGNAGFRNIGRFFLFAIPLVLGLGASVWFGLWVSGYEFGRAQEADKRHDDAYKHDLTQSERSAVYVGASKLPTGKLAVQFLDKTCMKIVRADLDTKKKGYPYEDNEYNYSLVLYAQSFCQEASRYTEWHWQAVSPNGTILSQGYTNLCPIPQTGEIAECLMLIPSDDRIEKFRAWASPSSLQ